MVNLPVLSHENFNAPFMVFIDASIVGLGTVLVQKSDLRTEQILAFASRSLNPAERNKAATELECLAVLWALEKCRTLTMEHNSSLSSKPCDRLGIWGTN